MEPMEPSTLQNAMNLINSGTSCKMAAAKLGLPNATLSRWVKRVHECGGDVEEATVPKETGRPVMFAATDFEVSLARWYRLNKESLTVAAWFFARDERVRPEIAEVVKLVEEKALTSGKREEWPESVRRAFRVTEEEKAAFRGKKASQQTEMVTRRGMFEILADGTHRDILPGNTWELDDYSANQPFIFKDPATGELSLGRQVLACRDLSAARWLGFDHIGRERDAYRGEDIVRYIERLVRSWGLPSRLRLERGSWESSYVHGIEVEGIKGRWGDLADLFEIEHVFKSKGKGIIEGGFNVLQRWLGHTGTDIGRVRGEFEEATKRLRQAQTTGIDPLTLGFLTQDKSSVLHEEAAATINSRPMKREHLDERVSPDDLVARNGWHTQELRESQAWYFLPYKVQRTVRAGTVEVSPGNGWPKMIFAINGVRDEVHLENGHQVLLAYDPARPELGARVANGDRSARNREGWGVGQLLIDSAPAMELAPQFNASTMLSPHMLVRKKSSAAAATTYRSVRAAAGTQKARGTREAVAMNGSGGKATAGDIERAEPQHVTPTAPAAETGPVPESIRTTRQTVVPVISSRAMPEDPQAEIRRLQAALLQED
jgi:hypothetical protein